MITMSFATFDPAKILPHINEALEVCDVADELRLAAATLGELEAVIDARPRLDVLKLMCEASKVVTLAQDDIAFILASKQRRAWLEAKLQRAANRRVA